MTESHETGMIFNIQRFSIDDGPGIRSTVFFKGCPLSCIWCHNPESHKTTQELFFFSQKCIGCGGCAAVCPNSCHTISAEGVHTFDRTACTSCGACAAVCCTKAIEMVGRTVTVEDVMKEVLSDQIFYEQSSGGITLSGGEPLSQPKFALALLRAAKAENLHTAIETSGYGTRRTLDALLPVTDLFLFDYKAPANDHKRLTGVENTKILDNLEYLSDKGAAIILRCPIIPGCSDTQEHYDAIAALAGRLSGITAVHLEPYHPLGISKAEQLGQVPAYANTSFLDKTQLQSAAASIEQTSGKPCRIS